MHLREGIAPPRKPPPIMDWFMIDMFNGKVEARDVCDGTLNVLAMLLLTDTLLITVC